MRIASFIVDPLLSSLLRRTKMLFSTLQFTIGLCHHHCPLLPFRDVSIVVLVGCMLCLLYVGVGVLCGNCLVCVGVFWFCSVWAYLVCLGLLGVMFGHFIFSVFYDLLSYYLCFLSMLFFMYTHVCINVVLHFK